MAPQETPTPDEARRERDEIQRRYGAASPEYASRVYEDMLDARYERRAALDRVIDDLGANLARENRAILEGRRARRVSALNAEADGIEVSEKGATDGGS